MEKLTIGLITLCYNEEKILPHFLRFYQPLVDWMVFFDGMSTDKTRDLIHQFPHTSIVNHDTGGKVDDLENIRVKNEAYKEMGADYFIVVDCDEFLYHPDLRFLVASLDKHGYNAIQSAAWQMVGDEMPTPDRPIAEQIQWGVRDEYTKTWFDKVCVFKKEVDIRYETGAHTQHALNMRLAPGKPVSLLHYKWLCREDVERKARDVKLSYSNHHLRLGYEPDTDIPSPDYWVRRYNEMRQQRVKIL
jgi:glycosyltransferase involved in cell wall biosynthesis